MKPTVLIVEDSRPIQKLYVDALGERAVLLQAYSQEEARKFFTDISLIACIIVDGNVPVTNGGSLGRSSRSTVALIKYFRTSGYTNRILAVAGDPKDMPAMISAGCDVFYVKNERGLLGKLNQAIHDVA